jgi:NhaP-type Na+/H+ or K+/H+ antiporter
VLAIFQELGVNKMLYFMVFGESLLNGRVGFETGRPRSDAVTIVLYTVTLELSTIKQVGVEDILLGFISFFAVALGGAALGVVCGLLAALITKHTEGARGRHESITFPNSHIFRPVVEPVVLYATAYLSYILAELFEFSGIVA